MNNTSIGGINMESKTFRNAFPNPDGVQFDFVRSVLSLLNTRRYLENQGFAEAAHPHVGIGNGYGEIRLSDGQLITHREFCDNVDRDQLLEEIINKNGSFEVKEERYYWGDGKNEVVTSNYKQGDFRAFLSVVDRTDVVEPSKTLLGILRKPFMPRRSNNWEPYLLPVERKRKNEQYGFSYSLTLAKDAIRADDLEQYISHIKGIEHALREDKPLTYAPRAPQRA